MLTVRHAAAQILADLHKERSHRDINPANILVVQRQGRVVVKLVDFAASRLHSEGNPQILAGTEYKCSVSCNITAAAVLTWAAEGSYEYMMH